MHERNLGQNCSAGFVMYPVSQAADILAFRADVVPVGSDQLPMIEITNEIGRRFNSLYNSSLFPRCEGLVPQIGRLPGIDGKSKMGKSLNNAIYLSATEDEVAAGVKKMFTDPNHLRVEDPGKVEGNTVFTYLDAFDTDRPGLESLKSRYREGGIADSAVKARLVEVLNAHLEPIRARRKEFSSDRGHLFRILGAGTEQARAVADQTLRDMRDAMGINYF